MGRPRTSPPPKVQLTLYRILTDPIGTEYPESEDTEGIRGWDSLLLTRRDIDTKLGTEGRSLEEVEQYTNPEFETVDFGENEEEGGDEAG